MVRRGTVSADLGWGVLFATRLAMGEPLGDYGAGGASCGGVFSLGGADLVSFRILCPRPLCGGWPPRPALDYQLTILLGDEGKRSCKDRGNFWGRVLQMGVKRPFEKS